MKIACILSGKDYKPGDPPPSGYLAWHEWAEVQHKAGLRQQQCCLCSKWYFPQELSKETITSFLITSKGESIKDVGPVCKKCHEKRNKISRLLAGKGEGMRISRDQAARAIDTTWNYSWYWPDNWQKAAYEDCKQRLDSTRDALTLLEKTTRDLAADIADMEERP